MYETVDESVELRVAATTQPSKLGGAIAKYLKEAPSVHLTAMGDAPIAVAVKSIIVAQSYVAYEAKELEVKMGFQTKMDEALEKEITLVVFYIWLVE